MKTINSFVISNCTFFFSSKCVVQIEIFLFTPFLNYKLFKDC